MKNVNRRDRAKKAERTQVFTLVHFCGFFAFFVWKQKQKQKKVKGNKIR